MRALTRLATRLTGKRVVYKRMWQQDDNTIFVPCDDEGGLLHEILHWIVASDEERLWPNLALDSDEVVRINTTLPADECLNEWTPTTPMQRERQVCLLNRMVFATRGQRPPEDASCVGNGRIHPYEIRYTLHRLRHSGTSIEELAAALTTGVCRYGHKATMPVLLGARLRDKQPRRQGSPMCSWVP